MVALANGASAVAIVRVASAASADRPQPVPWGSTVERAPFGLEGSAGAGLAQGQRVGMDHHLPPGQGQAEPCYGVYGAVE